MFDNFDGMPINAFGITRMPVIKLREIAPNDFLAVVLAKGIGHATVRFAQEPLGMLARKLGIDRAMIDNQVNHHLQSGGMGLRRHLPDLFLGRRRIFGIEKRGINPEIISN